MVLLIKIQECLSEMKNWEKLLAIILLISFICFMIGFFVYYPGGSSMLIKKTPNETSDIYLNVSKEYEYRIMLDPLSRQYSPKQLMVTVTQNSVVVKNYVAKLDIAGSCYEGNCFFRDIYSPECAAFIPLQNGEIKISIDIPEKGQNNGYFVKVYEGGSTKSYRNLCSFALYLLFFVIVTLIIVSGDFKRSTSAKIIALECAIILLTLVLTYYIIGGGCGSCM